VLWFLTRLFLVISTAETALSKVDPEAMTLVYQVNAVGPLLVMKVRNQFLISLSLLANTMTLEHGI
jgi:hypothetical protein